MTADASKLVDFLRREAAEEYMPAQKDMYLQAAAALEAARVDAWRYRLMCQLIDDGDSRVDAAIGDAYNLGAGALDLFLDELPVVVEYMLDDACHGRRHPHRSAR